MAAARCLRRVLGVAGAPYSASIRGTATVIPKVTQVDNSSDFLDKVPHRKHPGILHIKCVRLPPELVEVAQSLVSESSRRNLEKDTKALTNYLWSRKRPTEVKDLQQKALEVEKRLMREAGHTYNEDVLFSLDKAEVKNLQNKALNIIRKTTYHWMAINYTDELSFLYMAARMDGGFAAVFRAFHEIRKRVPDFQPSTLLDFGSGTGAVSWAARGIWGKTIKEYMNIDRSAPMLAMAERLMKGVSGKEELCFPGVYFRQFLPVSPKVKYDLVVSAFSLNELSSLSERTEIVQTLWRKTDGFLAYVWATETTTLVFCCIEAIETYQVLVENGTKEGHQILMEARDVVLKMEDKVLHDRRKPYVFAPCPHHLPCPNLSSACPLPCNFIQKYQPMPFHWNPVEREEIFSFLILRRVSEEPKESWPRIIKPVLCRPRHVHVHLCGSSGTTQHAVITPGKHGRNLYRCARSSRCGDCLPVLNPNSELDLIEDRRRSNTDQS